MSHIVPSNRRTRLKMDTLELIRRLKDSLAMQQIKETLLKIAEMAGVAEEDPAHDEEHLQEWIQTRTHSVLNLFAAEQPATAHRMLTHEAEKPKRGKKRTAKHGAEHCPLAKMFARQLRKDRRGQKAKTTLLISGSVGAKGVQHNPAWGTTGYSNSDTAALI